MSSLVRSGFFGMGSVKKRLGRATRMVKGYCKEHKKRFSLRAFTQDNLVLKSGQFPVAQIDQTMV